MGTIIARRRKDGSVGYTAQIVRKQNGKIVHREAKTFDRKQAAVAWTKKRETQLADPRELKRANSPNITLADAIDHFTKNTNKEIRRTKNHTLEAIKRYDIASMQCSAIGSEHIVSFAKELGQGRKPQTVGSYLSHLSAIFRIARPAWGFDLDYQAMVDALAVLKATGGVTSSARRTRRPSIDELNKLMARFTSKHRGPDRKIDMAHLLPFALFSTRRLDEITRIQWQDLNTETGQILVRDMKHPSKKVSNDVWCDLPPEALRILKHTPKTDPRIFPYISSSVSTLFTESCRAMKIMDLHFHDLRHEGISRLFEMGWTVPHVACVSGHRSWSSLQRYTHIRQTGDKYAGWKWLEMFEEGPS